MEPVKFPSPTSASVVTFGANGTGKMATDGQGLVR